MSVINITNIVIHKLIDMCGQRESNSRLNLGKVVFYH